MFKLKALTYDNDENNFFKYNVKQFKNYSVSLSTLFSSDVYIRLIYSVHLEKNSAI